jgi:hypothetical protein
LNHPLQRLNPTFLRVLPVPPKATPIARQSNPSTFLTIRKEIRPVVVAARTRLWGFVSHRFSSPCLHNASAITWSLFDSRFRHNARQSNSKHGSSARRLLYAAFTVLILYRMRDRKKDFSDTFLAIRNFILRIPI